MSGWRAWFQRWCPSEPQTLHAQDAAWMDREEARQMQELRERLNRVREQLSLIDRRKSERVHP